MLRDIHRPESEARPNGDAINGETFQRISKNWHNLINLKAASRSALAKNSAKA